MQIHSITIPKSVIGGDDLVIVRRKDFAQFLDWQEQTKDALEKIARGRKEYRTDKKSMVADSPHEFR